MRSFVSKFEILIEQIYNLLDRHGAPVQYVAPNSDGKPYIEKILRFLESDTTLLSRVIVLNNSDSTTHDQIVDFWNDVIKACNEKNILQDTPPEVWKAFRDSAFTRLAAGSPNSDIAQQEAWPGGPSVLQAFDDTMQLKSVENRQPFNAMLKDYQRKGLGIDHMFSILKAQAENALKMQSNTTNSNGISAGLAAAANGY